MIQLTSTAQLAKATARARAADLLVQPSSIFRQYLVTNRSNGHRYTVNFFVRGKERFADCTCQAGRHNRDSKHVAAAAGMHVCIAAERAAAAAKASAVSLISH